MMKNNGNSNAGDHLAGRGDWREIKKTIQTVTIQQNRGALAGAVLYRSQGKANCPNSLYKYNKRDASTVAL